MRGLRLSGHAWRSRLSSAAAALCTSSGCTASMTGAAVVVAVSCGTPAVSAVYSTWCFYSTTQTKQSTNEDVNSPRNTAVDTSVDADATSEDAMDLVWSAIPDVHEQYHEATLKSNQQEHGAATSTRATRGSPHEDSRASNANDTAASSPVPPVSYVWVSLHNMPRNWLHEDIVEMIHQVAEHAGIATPKAHHPPHSASGLENDATRKEDEEGYTDKETSSVLSCMSSPFVRRLHIPFGRRTGLVYGSPKLLLTSPQLADYLIHQLTFDPDDFRSRVYFTRTNPEELPSGYQQQQQQQPHEGGGAGRGAANSDGVAQVTYTPIEETVEREQDEALYTLVLDRYLFAPDLLLDIAKSHQRRLVTKNEKVLLNAFLDGEEDSDDEEADEDGEDVEDGDAAGGDSGVDDDAEVAAASLARRQRQRHRAKLSRGSSKKKSRPICRVRAGTQKHLGRGSMHNMPIPKPYVEGRNL